MKYLEYQEQAKVIAWARNPLILAKYKGTGLEFLHANHNTQLLTKAQAGRWKAVGGKSGIPDLFLPVPVISGDGSHVPGLYIEMKSPELKPKKSTSKGGLSDIQIYTFAKLSQQGYEVRVCYDANSAIKEIENYLSNTYEMLILQSQK